jgi:hypothetical protein
MTTLVLRPEYPFALVAPVLETQGWRRVPDPEAPEPAIPGEPELAAWTRDGAQLSYAFNPAIGLRTLTVRGQPDEQLFEQLPLLDVERVRELIRSGPAENVLLGLAAAREAGAVGLLPEVLPRIADDDELIADWATETAVVLGGRGLAHATEAVARARAERPGRSILYYGLPRPVRLQVLRWWIALEQRPEPGVVEFVQSALDDADWELRVTALLACGRLRIRELARAAAHVDLPRGVRDGVLPEERQLLLSVRELVALSLRRGLPDEARDGGLGRAVLAGRIDGADEVARLLVALTTPIPDAPGPERLPEGVVSDGESWSLRGVDVPLIWVPPIPHWLGDRVPPPSRPNPTRRVTPAHGFFVGAEPVTDPLARACGVETDGAGGVTYAGALSICRELSLRSNADVRPPTADQWEAAARGPDARRYPGGNTAYGTGLDVSPWGGTRFVGAIPQWTRDAPTSGHRVVCGSPGIVPCAFRTESLEGRKDVGLRVSVCPAQSEMRSVVSD